MIYTLLRQIVKSKHWLLILVFYFIGHSINAQVLNANEDETSKYYQDLMADIKLKNKIIPLSNPVYKYLDYLEANGKIEFLPQAKPYTKIEILKMLVSVYTNYWLPVYEKEIIDNFFSDFVRESNGWQLHKHETKNTFTLIGVSADATVYAGLGVDGTYSTSLIGLPYLAGDIGDHITFNAAIGGSFDRLAPDMFYKSYTKGGKVNFPYSQIGYAYLPYQFNYETLSPHVVHREKWDITQNINKELGLGMIYYTELNTSWYEGVIQLSLNNQRRSWGHDDRNLVLSSTARRFSGFEIKINPAPWIRYSMLTGSLFNTSDPGDTKRSIYGEDKGLLENLYTIHLLEYTPLKWLQISATAGTIWWKRLELAYLMPFTFSHFSELETGDFDNNTMSIDVACRIPGIGKTWLSFFNDEADVFKTGSSWFKMPRNRYAWQLGFKTGLIPGTSTTLKYTRLTPFVYTHYPEDRINIWNNRSLDMTYTHDGFNLGFNLPPNSGELNLTLVNIAIPDLILTLDNKMIIHGTNDLSNTNIYNIYGDIYKDQIENIEDYPLMNFTKDGIYDWTVMSDFKFDYKVRRGNDLAYFRVIGSIGFAGTWWNANQTGIVSPGSRTLFSGSLGVIIDM